ncbi:MAG: hypothetical protein ACJAX5_002364 [Patiriisocius sp.]|jgi:hypothetical protein
MKITVDVDITPEELRRFIGLPNVEKLQNEMIKNAQKYLQDAGQSQYKDLVSSAMQPMMAYQTWLQRMMTGDTPISSKTKSKKDGAENDD